MTHPLHRRALFGAAAALCAVPLAAPALGQGRFPNRPIRFLIPWPPGGALDALHRQMFEIMHKDLGQPVLIENRPGARGTQAALFLINQAQPDGYTLAHHHLSILRHPFLTKARTWDPVADFSYIMQVSGFLFGTAVRSDGPYRSFQDLIAAARRKPGELTFSTSGIATTNHLAMEEICEREGVQMTHVPFRGSQEGVTALLGRQIDVVADSSSWRPNVEAGELRLLSVWTRERLAAFPDVPTLHDLGYGMTVTSPYGIVGPKGMDAELVEFLHRAFRKAYEDEASQAIIRRWDMPKEYLGPAAYLSFARERVEYEKRMVARLNLSID
ncbi:tripartite tricarboxylate transporter substrate binding protein [Siccirubricoccus sp. KC 17139]|uniref:Tripartite tricarboxylate transporter substrate binding protein n=1 Tax=Siccirubricoccus soli TaxID=2899147 RepID=A0ABT1D099_9PROT|nr:tripartite tricarboxylate transporter substrate binding protein [Siccirubricoccus soli]MCO6415346.1 tripartite tricarboxylate transporter substrate binding protein [Siccirubricoccus soli]MCP2681478.1 tripartite tricarboxylate transporter substrate binding protein [Siccirubricoccus soli]